MNEQNIKLYGEISITNEYGRDILTEFNIDSTDFKLIGTSKLLSPTGYQASRVDFSLPILQYSFQIHI